jgi:uncharacterized protein
MIRLAFVPVLVLLALAPAVRAADDPVTLKAAAEELLKAMNTEKVLADSVDPTLDMMTKINPQLAAHREVMNTFLRKHLLWDAIKDDLIALYAKEYTAEEMRELTAFYKTPIGKKIAEKQAKVATKSAELGMKRVQQNQGELIRMLQDAQKK